MMKRLKVLVSAFACNPYGVSESIVGWSVVSQIARYNDVWVITRSINKKDIEDALAKQDMPGTHFVYFDIPPFVNSLGRFLLVYYFNYLLWQVGVYFIARHLHRRIQFDVTHQLTFAIGFIPGFLYLLPTPFIWGPINTGVSFPFSFMRYFSLRGNIEELLRRICQSSMRYNIFALGALKRAKAVLAFTDNKGYFSGKSHASKISPFPNGLSAQELKKLASVPFSNGNPFIVLSIVRLYYWKGVYFGICAFARLLKDYPDSEYWIMGDGKEKSKLLALADSLGVSEKVRFLGHISGEEKYSMLSRCDVFMLPSLREGLSIACLEAMASAKPVICLDIGGSSYLVDGKSGIKCRVDNPDQVIDDLAKGLSLLCREVSLRKLMGGSARARVNAFFNWDASGNFLNNIYQKATGQVI